MKSYIFDRRALSLFAFCFFYFLVIYHEFSAYHPPRIGRQRISVSLILTCDDEEAIKNKHPLVSVSNSRNYGKSW